MKFGFIFVKQISRIDFIIPNDLKSKELYNKNLYWIRAIKTNGSFEFQPVIENIVTNAVYAVNADSYQNEIIGSGTGAPGQVFRPSHSALLPGLKLTVNEGSIPSENEVNKIKKDGIDNPFVSVSNKEVWVTYKEVPNFYKPLIFSLLVILSIRLVLN